MDNSIEQEEKTLTEKESLLLITDMINKARNSYHDNGIAAIMWGCVITFCSLVMFAQLQFNFKLPFSITWLTLVAIIPQIFLTIKEKKERKAKMHEDVAMDYIWLGFGICIFLLSHVTGEIFENLNEAAGSYKTATGEKFPFLFNEYVFPLFLILYGLPTFITGGMCKFRPMFWGGIFCWVCSIISVYTHVKIDLLLTAAAATVAWLIPGLILKQDYVRAKRELKEQHV